MVRSLDKKGKEFLCFLDQHMSKLTCKIFATIFTLLFRFFDFRFFSGFLFCAAGSHAQNHNSNESNCDNSFHVVTKIIKSFQVMLFSLFYPVSKMLENKFKTIKNGKGFAFAVPLSSVIGVNIYQFLSNNKLGKEE